MKQDASTTYDDIDLVLFVLSQLARALRRAEGKAYVERVALQKADGVLACGSRDTRLSPGKTDHAATT